ILVLSRYPLIPLSRRLVLWGGIGVTVRARGSQAGRGAVAWIIIVVLVIALAGGLTYYTRRTGILPGQKLGGRVTVLGVWGGNELESFLAMVRPFETLYGVQVQFEGTTDPNAVLTTRLESGAASGWPATDWIEDIVLRTGGPTVYDSWYRHEIPWTEPAIKRAWELFGKIATSSKYAYGGADGVLATNFGESPFPMFTDPPGCYLHHQATFIQDFIQKQFPTLKPGEDFDFFAFPPIEQGVPKAVEAAGDLLGMF